MLSVGKKFVVAVFALISMFLLVNGVTNYGDVSGREFLYMGILLLVFLMVALIINKIITYLAEEKVFVLLYCMKRKMMIAEIVSISVCAVITLVSRFVIAARVQISTIGEEYEKLPQLFPARKVYEAFVGIFEGMAGGSISGYELCNIFCNIVAMVFIYLIVRSMYGRSGGILALFIAACWPSHMYGVVYYNPQYFCGMLFLAVIYFIMLSRKGALWYVFAALTGVALGLLIYMQTGMILFVVVLLASLFVRGDEGKERTLGENFMKRIPAVAVSLGVALIVNIGVNGMVATSLDLPSSKVTGMNGYAMLTGFNEESKGKENKEDYDYLMNNYKEGNNPKDAQMLCLGKVYDRVSENFGGTVNMILQKAQYVFGCGYDLAIRVDMSASKMIFVQDAYYLLILLGTGILAIELLQRQHHGYINFVLGVGSLLVFAGALFETGTGVQLEFGFILAICSSAIVSILYRRALGDDTIHTIEEIRRRQMEEEKKKQQWTAGVIGKLHGGNVPGETQGMTEEEEAEYFFDEEEMEEADNVDPELEELLSKLSIDPSKLASENVREKRMKKIQQAKEKQKQKQDNFDAS